MIIYGDGDLVYEHHTSITIWMCYMCLWECLFVAFVTVQVLSCGSHYKPKPSADAKKTNGIFTHL